MHQWKFWDWVAYGCLLLAALFETGEAAMKQAPTLAARMPNFPASELLPFLPLALVFMGTLILMVRYIFRPSPTTVVTACDRAIIPDNWNDPLTRISRQSYASETVVLDGKDFIECTFDNVTLQFNGTRPFDMENCQFNKILKGGTIQVSTGSPIVARTLDLFAAVGVFPPGSKVRIFGKDER